MNRLPARSHWFLSSGAASHITGQVLAVDGGFIGGGLVTRQQCRQTEWNAWTYTIVTDRSGIGDAAGPAWLPMVLPPRSADRLAAIVITGWAGGLGVARG